MHAMKTLQEPFLITKNFHASHGFSAASQPLYIGIPLFKILDPPLLKYWTLTELKAVLKLAVEIKYSLTEH